MLASCLPYVETSVLEEEPDDSRGPRQGLSVQPRLLCLCRRHNLRRQNSGWKYHSSYAGSRLAMMRNQVANHPSLFCASLRYSRCSGFYNSVNLARTLWKSFTLALKRALWVGSCELRSRVWGVLRALHNCASKGRITGLH